ncbi:MAG TPA: hypothetical protein PKD61_31715 [Polyangiaceae bacterium]|nr:hypothetical protein [Polyangiaceae bacterium]
MLLGRNLRQLLTRAFGVCVALLLALGQLSGLGHLVLVQHTVCAEHGDMHHEGSASHLPKTALESCPGIAVTTGDSPRVDDHDHCDGWIRVDEHALLPVVSVSAGDVVHAEQVVASIARAAALPPIGLLALAPKLAPPSA